MTVMDDHRLMLERTAASDSSLAIRAVCSCGRWHSPLFKDISKHGRGALAAAEHFTVHVAEVRIEADHVFSCPKLETSTGRLVQQAQCSCGWRGASWSSNLRAEKQWGDEHMSTMVVPATAVCGDGRGLSVCALPAGHDGGHLSESGTHEWNDEKRHTLGEIVPQAMCFVCGHWVTLLQTGRLIQHPPCDNRHCAPRGLVPMTRFMVCDSTGQLVPQDYLVDMADDLITFDSLGD